MKFASREPLRYGANAAAEFDEKGWPRFIRITDVNDQGILRDETFRSLPPEIAAPFQLGVGDILLARSGATVGKSFIYDEQWGEACFAGYLIRFRTGANFYPKYIYWWLQSAEYWGEVKSNLIQSTIQNVSAERYGNFDVPVFPLETQQRIARFLDEKMARIDALIEKKQALLERLAEKRQALITRAVTKGLNPDAPMKPSGVDWLGDIPQHWDVVALNKATTKITNGYVGPTRDIFMDEGVRYIQSLHIKNNRIIFKDDYFVAEKWSGDHEKSILAEGDVLIVQTGDIGQVAHVTSEFAGCNCHALIICTPMHEALLGEYLSWLLCSDYGQQFLQLVKTGALHPHLNCGNVKFFSVLVPPLNEQVGICDVIRTEIDYIERCSRAIEGSAVQLRSHRSALITAAVTGQLPELTG